MSAQTTSHHKALLLIDIQAAFEDNPEFYGSQRSNPAFERNVAELLQAFRYSKVHIFHVYHISSDPASPLYDGKPGVRFASYATPLEHEKLRSSHRVDSAFGVTGLEYQLRQHGIRELYVCGLTAEHCVSTSIRMAANYSMCDWGEVKGRIVLVKDATASFNRGEISAEAMHKASVKALEGEYCELMTTTEVVQELQVGTEKAMSISSLS
jgi:nicotinamidase-related amidase